MPTFLLPPPLQEVDFGFVPCPQPPGLSLNLICGQKTHGLLPSPPIPPFAAEHGPRALYTQSMLLELKVA